MLDIQGPIKHRYEALSWALDERMRRLFVAAEAQCIGRGGISCMSKVSGMSRVTINAGLQELKNKKTTSRKVRQPGGGRKSLAYNAPQIVEAVKDIVESTTRGDPESPLLWTCKSSRNVANELGAQGHKVSHTSVTKLLDGLGYSLQGNRKVLEGAQHPDRNAQFEFINLKVKDALQADNPVISVDTKKKELVGQYKNPGKVYRPKGRPEQVKVYDFVDKNLGRANPYGVYDVTDNVGWISVGTDHDTASFAVETIRRWWNVMGRERYPKATELLITADGGGSNGTRVRLWKKELQNFANDIGFPIRVSHLPPGTSKWNKIEHRMFCHISMNWRGRPLISHEVMVELISNTCTRTGLTIKSEVDKNLYPLKVKVSKTDFDSINITKNPFHGEWNYVISPITS